MDLSLNRTSRHILEQAKLNSPESTSAGDVKPSQEELQNQQSLLSEEQNQIAEPRIRLQNLLVQAGLPVNDENLQLLEMMMTEKIQITIPMLKELRRTLQNLGLTDPNTIKAAVYLAARGCPISAEHIKLAQLILQESGLGKQLGELLDKLTLPEHTTQDGEQLPVTKKMAEKQSQFRLTMKPPEEHSLVQLAKKTAEDQSQVQMPKKPAAGQVPIHNKTVPQNNTQQVHEELQQQAAVKSVQTSGQSLDQVIKTTSAAGNSPDITSQPSLVPGHGIPENELPSEVLLVKLQKPTEMSVAEQTANTTDQQKSPGTVVSTGKQLQPVNLVANPADQQLLTDQAVVAQNRQPLPDQAATARNQQPLLNQEATAQNQQPLPDHETGAKLQQPLLDPATAVKVQQLPTDQVPAVKNRQPLPDQTLIENQPYPGSDQGLQPTKIRAAVEKFLSDTLADLAANRVTDLHSEDSPETINFKRFLLTTLKELLPLNTQSLSESTAQPETVQHILKEQLQTTGEVWQAKGLLEKMLAGISKESGLQDLFSARELIQGVHQKADPEFVTYIPIPITNGEHFRSGELYVWDRKRKNEQNNDEESSMHILFLLNTSGLGNWRIDLVARGEQLSLNIMVHTDQVNKVVKSNLTELEQRIEKLGFKVNHIYSQVAKESESIISIQNRTENISSDGRVDIRI